MGLANLVPGVSGGTMLLATGVYPHFIESVAEFTKLRWRREYLVTLACVVGAGSLAIVLLAGPTKDLVVAQRWIMYSLFIGLTLGGVPIVWKLLGKASAASWAGTVAGLVLMIAIANASAGDGSAAETSWLMLAIAGVIGAAAMVLPGISGGYRLLLMGQYVPVLAAIERFKTALTGSGGPDVQAAFAAGLALVPLAAGVAIGVTAVSNAVKWALARFRQVTLGFLLGLLLGAVLGLWPFQRSVVPLPGSTVKGQVVTAENLLSIPTEDWPLERFAPTAGQVAGSLALVVAGFGATLLIGLLGAKPERAVTRQPTVESDA
jgi:putative membrane protein